MATVVKHRDTGNHYILLGTSYSYFKDSRPSIFGGNLFPHEEEGEYKLATVCNEKGYIEWFSTRDLTVVQVDNCNPEDLLNNYNRGISSKNEVQDNINDESQDCPNCGKTIKYWYKECPNCGLTLTPVSDD